MTDHPTDRLLAMLYAATEAIASGEVAEIELEHNVAEAEMQQNWSITLRREVRHLVLPAAEPE